MNANLSRRLTLSILALVLAAGAPLFANPDSATSKKSGGSIWGANYFPNVELTTHEGKKVRFFDDLIEGKVVVINFIYTSCPDACPLETAQLAEVQQILGDRVGDDLHMYSITIDPDHDTPEVLAEYRERYQAAPGWTFLTGAEKDITLLRKKLGLYIDDLDQEAGDHNLNIMLGNQPNGRWEKASPFENPYWLARQISGSLTNYSKGSERKDSYENAPKLRSITDGESLFRTRCAVCHTIGKTTEADLKPRVGPDLLGVTTRREKAWLERWIREPDVMLAEGDSIATGLFYAYNQVPMPNMRLSKTQVGQLLSYIETEEKRVEKHEQLLAVLPVNDEDTESCCQKGELNVLASTAESESEESCCDEDASAIAGAECEKTGDADCCCEADVAESSGQKNTPMPAGVWSGLGVLLGGFAMVLRRRAL